MVGTLRDLQVDVTTTTIGRTEGDLIGPGQECIAEVDTE